jgi:hypothetical protein
MPVVSLVLACALLSGGCADDAFLPTPDNLPPGQAAPSDDSQQPPPPPEGG